MGRYLQLIAMSRSCEISEVSQGPVLNSLNSQMQPGRRGEFHAALRALDAQCPERVHDHRRWRQAVTDGEAFLARWGEQALLLAWTVDERKIVSYEANSGHQTYVDLFYCNSLFGLTNETSSGETAAGNALRYGGRQPERTRCLGRQGVFD
jgi:hypothetical protein